MIATLIALLIGIGILFLRPESGPNATSLSLITAAVFFVSWVVGGSLLQTLRRKPSPLTGRMPAGRHLSWLGVMPVLFLFVALAAFMVDQKIMHWVWLVYLLLVGASIDLWRGVWSQIGRSGPTGELAQHQEAVQKAVNKGDDEQLAQQMQRLAQTSLVAANNYKLEDACESLGVLTSGCTSFLDVHWRSLQSASPEAEIYRRASYLIVYAAERIESIFDQGLQRRLDPLCGEAIQCLIRIALAAARGDGRLANYPIAATAHSAMDALRERRKNVADRARAALQHLCQALVEQDMGTHLPEALFSGLAQLDGLSKAYFKSDRTTPLPGLKEPFVALRSLLEGDTREELKPAKEQINRVLADFANLETVISRVPPLDVESIE